MYNKRITRSQHKISISHAVALNISLILIEISNHGNQILLIVRTLSDTLHNKS